MCVRIASLVPNRNNYMSGSLHLDSPMDPKGYAYVELQGNGRFTYAVICDGRKHFTNNKARWKKHYKAAKKRGLAGTWFVWDSHPIFGLPYYRWCKILLSVNAFGPYN